MPDKLRTNEILFSKYRGSFEDRLKYGSTLNCEQFQSLAYSILTSFIYS